MTSLYPYQREGVAWLADRKVALLADEPGLGKSAQAIRACDAIGAKKVLVVCPASLRVNWAREFGKFQTVSRTVYPLLGHREELSDVLIVSYELAAKHPEALAGAWDVLILDEAHYLKTRTAKRTKAIYGERCDRIGGIAENADVIFALTGTPAPNHPDELWPMLRAFGVLEKRVQPYWSFVTRYCRTRDNGFGLEILGGRNLEELKARMDPYVLRRKKTDVLPQLPDLRLDTLYLDGFDVSELSRLSREFSGRIEQALAENGVEGLRKVAPHVAELRRLTGTLKVPGVLQTLRDEQPEKMVLFAHHRDVIDQLYSTLHDEGFGPVVVHGGCGPAMRQSAIDAFQTDPNVRVFIGQLQAAGVGITLTAASEAIVVESSWVPAENEQAVMRIHRIGQKDACRVRFATLANSIDEKINMAVMRKTADILQLFN